MVLKEQFIDLIKLHKEQSNRIDQFSELGLQIFDHPIIEFGYVMFSKLINTWFTPEGSDWIYWWLYEKSNNPNELKAWDENKKEIPTDTIDDLWSIIKKYRK